MTHFAHAVCVLIAMSLFQFGPAQAEPIRVAIEDAVETASDAIILPSSDAGTILRRDCQACNATPLQLTRESHFYIGETNVTFETLSALLKKSRRTHSLVIFHRFHDHTVTRFVVTD